MRILTCFIALSVALFVFQNCSELKSLSQSSSQVPLDNNPGPLTQNPPIQNPPIQNPPVSTKSDPICGTNRDLNFPKFPNEPTNFRRVVDWGFDAIEGQNLLDAYADPEKKTHFITECNDAPISPNSVLKNIRMASEVGYGGIQIDYVKEKFNEVYVGLVWKANPGFEGGYSNRLFIILTNGVQNFVAWGKYENKTLDEGYIGFSPVAGPEINNCGLIPGDRFCQPGPANMPANVKPNHVASRNKWNLVEAILKRNSAPGVKDGRIRWYLNGELLGDYSGLDVGGKQIDQISYQQGWVDRKLTREGPQASDWYYLTDHIRISGI